MEAFHPGGITLCIHTTEDKAEKTFLYENEHFSKQKNKYTVNKQNFQFDCLPSQAGVKEQNRKEQKQNIQHLRIKRVFLLFSQIRNRWKAKNKPGLKSTHQTTLDQSVGASHFENDCFSFYKAEDVPCSTLSSFMAVKYLKNTASYEIKTTANNWDILENIKTF